MKSKPKPTPIERLIASHKQLLKLQRKQIQELGQLRVLILESRGSRQPSPSARSMTDSIDSPQPG